MASKRKSNSPRFGGVGEAEEAVVEVSPVEVTIRVAIQSVYPARLKYIGTSGEAYEWKEAGSIVEVNVEDVPVLLSKKIGGKGCCGVTSDGNVLFQRI